MHSHLTTPFTQQVGIKYPIIGGAMYPCSNPELVAAVSNAGGIGIVQPISLVYVNKYDFREGLRAIKSLTANPIGVNLLIEKSSKTYLERNKQWLTIALEEGVRFFITALGNPDWVVSQAHAAGAVVYHDVTAKQWADKAIKANVDGLICVNNQAGGHAGELSPEDLADTLRSFRLPIICAGGISNGQGLRHALDLGYAGVQMGTRFIASQECNAHQDYKNAILNAQAEDIILTRKITGIPVSIIKTPYVEAWGTELNPLLKKLLKHPKAKHFVRTFLSLKSIWELKKSWQKGSSFKDYFQAGKSVAHIDRIEPVADIINRMVQESGNQ